MRAPSRALTVLLFVVAIGLLAQPILAGYFIAGVANLRLAHAIVGSALLWVGIVPAVVALASRRARDGLSWTVRGGAVLLAVGLWVQNALGHMPFATSTVVHVPLGTALVAGAFALAIASLRPRRTAPTPASPPPPPSAGDR